MSEERARIALVGLLVLCAVAAGVLVGRATNPTHRGAAPAAVVIVGGVAVGVLDTPAGALAAADDYLASASQTVEQDPSAFTALVAAVYAHAARAGTLAAAVRARSADVVDMRNYAQGGRAVAVVAARRLDRYTPGRATVTSWLGGFVWGPGLSPRQSWNLVDTTLIWRRGRWLVGSMNTEHTPAPVPSVVFVNGHNNQSSTFNARLGDMTAPFYGAD
jgi:hypothetical protein